jgi:hypothetical protein
MMQWYEMPCMPSLLPSNPTKGSEGCNHVALTCVAIPVLTTPISGYDIFLCIPKEGTKIQHCNAWTSDTSNFNRNRNTTINDKVYSKISKITIIYQVIWLMWILKLNEGNLNNKWKHVDHGATFTCLLQLSSHKAKHDLKEHHLITRKIQH